MTCRCPDDTGFDALTDSVAAGGGLLGRLVALAVLAAVAAQACRCIQQTHRRRTTARPAAKPERLQTWEAEGGRPDPEPGTVFAPSVSSP